jgi:hypothetical protein
MKQVKFIAHCVNAVGVGVGLWVAWSWRPPFEGTAKGQSDQFMGLCAAIGWTVYWMAGNLFIITGQRLLIILRQFIVWMIITVGYLLTGLFGLGIIWNLLPDFFLPHGSKNQHLMVGSFLFALAGMAAFWSIRRSRFLNSVISFQLG